MEMQWNTIVGRWCSGRRMQWDADTGPQIPRALQSSLLGACRWFEQPWLSLGAERAEEEMPKG